MGVYNSYFTRQLIGRLAPQADLFVWSGGAFPTPRAGAGRAGGTASAAVW